MTTTPLAEGQALRIGMIGLDTSHVEAFTRLLLDEADPHHVPGGRVVAAFPGGSSDMELSHTRVAGFTAKLRDDFGVTVLDSPEAVAERVDLLFIESVDGRVHRDLLERTIRFGKPTFIDKPVATTLADAQAIFALAESHGVAVMSSSALRYADNFRAALADDRQGALVGIATHGPMSIEPTQPGYFWYGLHAIEMIVAAMGTGCRRVRSGVTDAAEVVTAAWDDRVATFYGVRRGHKRFGVTLHRADAAVTVDVSAVERPFYASLLEAILGSLPHGRADVPPAETLEVVRIIEAANRSRETGEEVVISR